MIHSVLYNNDKEKKILKTMQYFDKNDDVQIIQFFVSPSTHKHTCIHNHLKGPHEENFFQQYRLIHSKVYICKCRICSETYIRLCEMNEYDEYIIIIIIIGRKEI